MSIIIVVIKSKNPAHSGGNIARNNINNYYTVVCKCAMRFRDVGRVVNISNASAAAVDSIIIILFSSRTRSPPVPSTRIRPGGGGGGGDLSIFQYR